MSGAGPNGTSFNGATWADFDNDGYPDLFIFNGAGHNWLFHNNRDGTFSQVHGAPFDTDPAQSPGAAWGDYDNDGYLDLFVANGSFDSLEHHNYLYHNNGNGTFTKVTTGNIVTDSGSAVTAAWEDFDNDGCLDLFVSYNTGVGRSNALYHNNGDGTFTSATNIAPFKFRPACHRCLRLRAEKLKCHRPGIAKVGLLRIEVEYGAGQETGVLRLISDLVSSPKANTQGAG